MSCILSINAERGHLLAHEYASWSWTIDFKERNERSKAQSSKVNLLKHSNLYLALAPNLAIVET